MSYFSKEKIEERKAKKARWKEYKRSVKIENKVARKLQREKLKEEYADAPVLTRFLHVNACRIVVTIISIAVVAVCIKISVSNFLQSGAVTNMVWNYIYKVDAKDVPADTLHELSPIDEEGADRINQIPSNDADDTWTFCVYMVGSNLEDMLENDLSDSVRCSWKYVRGKVCVM